MQNVTLYVVLSYDTDTTVFQKMRYLAPICIAVETPNKRFVHTPH